MRKVWSYWPHVALAIFLVLVAYAIGRTAVFQACYADHKEYASYQQQQESFLALKWIFRNFKVSLKCGGTWAEHSHGLLTALATFAIAGFTWTLWRATEQLRREGQSARTLAENTAKNQLRAYIGHEPNGLHFETRINPGNNMPEQRGPVKYFERNYGLTPAKNIRMYVKVIAGLKPPESFAGPLPKMEVMQTIYPQQTIGKIVDPKFNPSHKFFLYGFIDYQDIFDGKWRRRFAFSHDPERTSLGYDDRVIAHHEHNDEIPQPAE